MGFQMQRQPVVFLRVFQLGLRDLGVGILPLLLRSTAPLSRIQRSLSSYLLLLWKTKMRKDTNLQKKVYCHIQYLTLLFRRQEWDLEPGTNFSTCPLFFPKEFSKLGLVVHRSKLEWDRGK